MTGQARKLILADVTKCYDAAGAAVRRVLDGVSLAVEPGETLAIVGPSGSGKSTLLNIIGSLDRPTSGSVRLGEVDVAALEGAALAYFRAREVGFVFQDHHLLPQLTALENVLLPSLALGGGQAAVGAAVGLLERVGLGGQAASFPSRMSGGERQRVAVARALVNGPNLLLCDEPTGNLDREAGEAVVSLFVELAAERGVAAIMVTHNLGLAARFSRCMELRGGRLAVFDARRGESA